MMSNTEHTENKEFDPCDHRQWALKCFFSTTLVVLLIVNSGIGVVDDRGRKLNE